MTGGLAHSPASQPKRPSFPNFNVDTISKPSGSSRRASRSRTSLKLFDDPANAPFVDPFSDALDSEQAVRAAVSAHLETANARPQAAQQPPKAGGLGSGGATVPRSGNVAPPLLLSSSETDQFRGSSTVSRYALLAKVQRLCRPKDPDERGPAVCGCGRPGEGATHVNIHLRYGEQTGELRAGVSGIYRCGSPWLCPTCAPAKALKRAERVQAAATATFLRGGRAALVVLTAAHSMDMSLAEIKELVQGSSSAARKGRVWVKAVADYGILGVIVGQEVTFSLDNGWHYHQHLSILVDGPDADAYKRAKQAGEWIAKAYSEKVRDKDGEVSDRYGWHVRVARDAADASDYTAKGSMAWEVAGGYKDETKSAKSLTPWDIAVAASVGDKQMFAKWKEYEATMPGTRSCVVSAALAKKLGLTAEPQDDDDDNSEQLYHETDDVVGRVEAPVWSRWMRHGLASTFLLRVEYGGEAGFAGAVEQTEAESMEIESRWQARNAEREREHNEQQASHEADRLLRLAADDVKRHLHERGIGGQKHVHEVVERIAIDNPGTARLDPGRVLSAANSNERDKYYESLVADFAELGIYIA
ncbi:hypothetical protein [Rhizobium mayense]|uniref:Replication protein n=1 Tax=Rhizobium mayense TaxID=1312184 RepID=A0ABT7JSV8_9HYPH|nr:hypothetical protein [Rhizobium mayense]MDL2399441.1 hypothetical protein [Rhizobium mayense]